MAAAVADKGELNPLCDRTLEESGRCDQPTATTFGKRANAIRTTITCVPTATRAVWLTIFLT